MSAERTPLDLDAPRFFRAMVLMGGTLALGCAGSSLDTTGGGSGGSGGNNAGQGGTGGKDATTGGTGGTDATTGGTGAGSTGGTDATTGGTGAGSAGGTSCSPEQWSCSALPLCGVGAIDGYVLPTNCTCEPGRPLSGAECESGRRACLEATQTSDGEPLERSIPFQCDCAPFPTSCNDSCHAVFPDGDGHRCSDVEARLAPQEPIVAPDDILCGCSFVFLK